MSKESYNISEHNFEQCLKCTVCTAYCPVAAVNPEYPGPKQAGPDGERYRLKNADFFDEKLKLCLNCKRCEVACPSGVNIGDIILAARIKHSRHTPSMRDRMLASTDFVGTMATLVAPIVNASLNLSPAKTLLDSFIGIDKHASFPSYTGQKFTTWYRRYAAAEQEQYPKQITFFHGCYINYNYPQLGKDFIKVMNAMGYGVKLLDNEKCCGVAMISNGLISQATKHANININAIRNSVAEGRPVVGASSTCILTMRDEYPHILGIDNTEVRESINLATRFIYQQIESGKARIAFRNDYKARLAYHTACHVQRLGWGIFSTELLKMIPGVELTVLESQCCGIAGTYGFKKENYPYSQAIGAGLFKQIAEVNPEYVTTDCETCKMQIEMSTPVHVKHPVSILAEAIDVEKTKKLNGLTA